MESRTENQEKIEQNSDSQPKQVASSVSKIPTKTKFIVIGGVVLLAIIIVGLVGYKNQQKKQQAIAQNQATVLEKVSLRLNWINNACFAGFYVAKEKGFYKNAGLDVSIKEYQENLDQSAEVGADKVDFGLSTPIETLTAIDSGQKVKTIAAINQISPEAFASLKKVNILSPVDLKGKVLGVHGGNKESIANYTILLNSVGLKKTDATFKDQDYNSTVAEHLLNKDSDIIGVYRTDDTYDLDQKGLAYNLLLPESFGVVGYGDILITSDVLIKKNPTMVKKFVTASLEGWKYAIAHPDEALTITKKYETGEYKNAGREKYILEHYAQLIQPTGGQQIGSMAYVTWSKAVRGLQLQGIVKQAIDPAQVYTTQFLN